MKRYLVLSWLIVLSFSSVFATETRVSTMGKEGWLLVDNSNVFDFPAQVLSFPNQVIAELGSYPSWSSADRSIGVLATNNEELTWGVIGLFANRSYRQLRHFEHLRLYEPDLEIPEPRFDILYGRQFGGLQTGLAVEWAENSSEGRWADTLDYAVASRLLGVKGGVHRVFGRQNLLDLGLAARRLSFSVEGNDTLRDRGKLSFEISARAFRSIGDFLAVVPYLSIRRDDMSYEVIQAGSPLDVRWTETSFRGGIGFNITPYREMTLVVGLLGEESISEFDSTSGVLRYEYSDTRLTAPALTVGVESEIRDWLLGRVAAQKSLVQSRNELVEGDVAETSIVWSAPFDLSLGLGLRVGDFVVDTELSSELPFTLGYALSGRQGDVFAQVSATYSFEIF